MQLEPIYLVGPPAAPVQHPHPTRRLLLGMVLAFATGGATGGTLARAFSRPKPEAAGPATTDLTLAWLLHLADASTDISELIASSDSFLMQLDRNYPRDDRLWGAVGRLAREVLDRPYFPARRTRAHAIAQLIERHHRSEFDPALVHALNQVQ